MTTRNFALALLIFTSLAIAPAVAAAGEIGVVNMQKVLAKYNKVKKINDQLQSEKDKLQSKLDTKQESLKKLKEKLDEDFKTLADKEKQARGKELEKNLEELQDYHDNLMTQLREKQADKYKELEDDIVVAVKKVAGAQGLDMVIEKGVVFTGGKDITEDVVAELNGGAAPARDDAGEKKPAKSDKKKSEK